MGWNELNDLKWTGSSSAWTGLTSAPVYLIKPHQQLEPEDFVLIRLIVVLFEPIVNRRKFPGRIPSRWISWDWEVCTYVSRNGTLYFPLPTESRNPTSSRSRHHHSRLMHPNLESTLISYSRGLNSSESAECADDQFFIMRIQGSNTNCSADTDTADIKTLKWTS
jgi:hypothetical protein